MEYILDIMLFQAVAKWNIFHNALTFLDWNKLQNIINSEVLSLWTLLKVFLKTTLKEVFCCFTSSLIFFS